MEEKYHSDHFENGIQSPEESVNREETNQSSRLLGNETSTTSVITLRYKFNVIVFRFKILMKGY